jgi:hypothetical protein
MSDIENSGKDFSHSPSRERFRESRSMHEEKGRATGLEEEAKSKRDRP